MKRIAFLILLAVSLSNLNLNAQFTPMRSTMSTPYGNINTTNYVYTPLYYGNNGVISYKYDFTAILTNDSILQGHTRINIKDSVRSITFKKDKEKVTLKPSETKELYRMTLDGNKLIGIPNDSCWLFKTESGKVNLYSFLAEPGTDYVTAMQIGDNGQITALKKENVQELVKDNPKLMKLVEKGRLLKALRDLNKE